MRYIFFFIIFLLPSHSFCMDPSIKKFANYKVVVKWDEDLDGGKVLISKDKKMVYTEGESGNHYWIGNHSDNPPTKDDLSGKDLTGNEFPELIITQWTGGAHCCTILSVFEMGEPEIKKWIAVDGGSNGFEIRDLDGDKFPEIEFWDWPIDYLFNCFADSSQGRVVLKFVDGQYHVASSLMYRRRPNNDVLTRLKNEIKKSFQGMGDNVPYELLDLMMKLSYTGYKELAMEIANETWPKDRVDLKKFEAEFKNALSNSVYWSEFNRGKH